jgi:DNA-binding transcriptional regulator YhcF (GntR family)
LLIATKQFQVDEQLPSTRELGKQLNVSFHTVRKAYLQLQEEGLIESALGKGYIVKKQRSKLNKEARIEYGADKMKTLLEELIGYGLTEDEIETVFEEQLTYMEWPDSFESCASVGVNTEHAQMISGAIKRAIGVKSDAVAWNDPNVLIDYDALFVPVSFLRHFQRDEGDVHIIPVVYQFHPQSLIDLANRAEVNGIGLVTQREDSIPLLLEEIKAALKPQTSLIAGTIYGKSLPLFARDSDVILYPIDTASLVEKLMPEKRRIGLEYQIADVSLNMIRAELWDQ